MESHQTIKSGHKLTLRKSFVIICDSRQNKNITLLIYNKITFCDHLPQTYWTPPSLNPLVEEPQHSVESRTEPHEHIEWQNATTKMTRNIATNP